MADERIEGVYTIRVEDGPALRAFERMNQQLTESRLTRQALQKQIKQDIAEERNLQAVQKATGTLTAEQSARLKDVQAALKAKNATVSEAIIVERGLGGQMREVSNRLSGLEEHQLRFRDKMAQATREALEQSGVLNQLGVRTDVLKNDIQELAAAYQRGEKSEKDFRTENERLQAELVQVSQRSDKLEKEVEELNREFKAGLIDQKAYREGLSRIEEETRRAGVATSGLSQKFDTFAKGQGAELKSTLSSLAMNYVGVGAAIYGVQRVLGSAMDAVLDFDQNLAKVSALGGEYAASIDALGDAAQRIGPKFGVGPAQAVESIEALAKAGVSASDILGGALEGALVLAASGTMDAGQAAEYASAAMTQFGLSGSDVTHVADLLSAAANKAMGEVSDFGNALKFIGPVAASNNIPLEEVVGTLALFAQNGILGEMAGTSLRGALSSLTSPSKEASKELARLGVVTEDGTNKLYDANGQFKGLANTAEVLREATKDLTDEERNAALGRIFGNQQLTAANILLKSGGDAVRQWTADVNDSGIAARIAADQQDSLRGSIAKMTAAWEGAVTSIVNGKGPIANAFKAATAGAAEFFNLITKYEQQVSGEIGFSKSMGVFVDGINAGRDAMSQLSKDSDAFDEIAKKYEQRVASLRNQKDAELQLQQAIDLRAQALARVDQLEARAATGEASPRLALEIAAAKATVLETQKLIEAQKSGAAAAAAQTKAQDELTASTEKATDATKAQKAEVQNVTGSIADLNAQIQDLTTKQAQSTSSEQFATYDAQIDQLTQKVKLLKGEITQEMFDIAQGGTERMDTRITRDIGTERSLPVDLAAEGLNPNDTELLKLSLEERTAIIEEWRLQQLQSSKDYNDQLAALDIEWKNGSIATEEEYNARRNTILQEQAMAEAEIFQQSAAAFGEFLGQAFTGQLKEAEDFRKAFLKILISMVRAQVNAALIGGQGTSFFMPDSVATFGAAGLARNAILAALANGLLSGLEGAIQGFAKGGHVGDGGIIGGSWGTPIRRANGDNVLITAKSGEAILNDEQQARVRRRTGMSIGELAGLPGSSTRPSAQMPRASDYFPLGYASGGTVGYPAVSLSSSQMGQSTMISELRAVRENPVWLSLTELDRAQGRMAATREVGQA